MIFRCKSLMKKELRQHKSRMSNAIEAFHSALYKLMLEKRQPVATSLRLLLQVAEYHGMMMLDLYENNIRPHYGNNQKKTTAKKYATLYEIKDGRAPDNNAALFGSKKRKQQVVIIGDEENGKRKKAKKLETRGTGLNAAINEHLDEVIEIEQNCPKIDDIADGNISDERFFLELLSDSDGENGEVDDRYHITENLENDIKDMLKGAGVSVEDVVVNSDESFESSVIDLVSSSSSSSSIMKTKSEPTASKMRAPTDSDFSLSSSSSNLSCLAIQPQQQINLRLRTTHLPLLASCCHKKRTSLLQKYQWLVKDDQNNHPDSHPSLPVPTYIVSNESNSCFIDAFFELLFNAVLPFVDMSFADENNAYDCLLMNAFESYSQQSPSGIRAATSTVRHFVWNMTEYKLVSGVRQLVKSFPKGRQGDILDLASMVLERLSSVFASKVCTFPSLQCERKVPCSVEKSACVCER
ncbi:uncharacterized protein ATC70_005248 [Mucor velutinosus]|uniref:Uncharacterized protein n=1 Tax=Mucor velutinosus TaxID=708070 RepID=A0AAN7HKC8_9FUNG|nr:hypothetical protein ATC70_005248 [Mucor velutinosus]